MKVKVEALPEVTSLSGGDVVVLNKENSFTGKVTLDNLKEYILRDIVNALNYTGDNKTISLSSNNAFYVLPNSIEFSNLSPALQDQLSTINQGGNQGATLTGTIQTFTTPLTATGNFLIVNVNNSYYALRVWDGV